MFDEEKAMRSSLERGMIIALEKELLAPKEEPQLEPRDVVGKAHMEEQTTRKMEAPTQP